jgi:fibronectin type 3 domain-containing protein
MFAPSATGTRTASLSVADNANGSPQTAMLEGTGTHDVILTWNASTTPGIAGYNVYRGTSSEGESSTPLNSTPLSGATFTDSNVTAGGQYSYVVTAVASDGSSQSANSNEVSATVPSP